MSLIPRAIISLVAFAVTEVALIWVFVYEPQGSESIEWAAMAGILVCSIVVGMYVWTRLGQSGSE